MFFCQKVTAAPILIQERHRAKKSVEAFPHSHSERESLHFLQVLFYLQTNDLVIWLQNHKKLISKLESWIQKQKGRCLTTILVIITLDVLREKLGVYSCCNQVLSTLGKHINCHIRLNLGFSAKLRIWQFPACKMEPLCGIIFNHETS